MGDKPFLILLTSKFILYMIFLLSPAKSLDFDTEVPTQQLSEPEFLDQSEYLINKLQKLSVRQVKKLMNISEELGQLNVKRFQDWSKKRLIKDGRQAIFAFKGDVYLGLDAYSLNEQDANYAQQHIRILSGLYGLLKPLDLMLPYRLEMGVSFSVTPKKNNLYKYWDSQLTEHINRELEQTEQSVVINLASGEYFKAIKPKMLKGELLNVDFKDWKNGEYKMIGFFAKKARGLMARFAIDHQVKNPEQLKEFSVEG